MTNEEKILSLMEKMYTELTEFKVETKEEFTKINQSLTRIEQDQGSKTDLHSMEMSSVIAL